MTMESATARTLVLAIAAGALAACATAPTPETADMGAPQPTPGKDWFFHADETGAMLAYGVEASDDLGFRFDCAPGSGLTELLLPVAEGASAETILLESGGATETWQAMSEPAQLDDGQHLMAKAEIGHPLFRRFRQLGWLAVNTGDQRQLLVAQPGSEPRVEQYFKTCE